MKIVAQTMVAIAGQGVRPGIERSLDIAYLSYPRNVDGGFGQVLPFYTVKSRHRPAFWR